MNRPSLKLPDRFVPAAHQPISATVPSAIVQEVRKLTGKRGFSRFVATALAHELQRRAMDEFLAHAEATSPVSGDDLQRAATLLTT